MTYLNATFNHLSAVQRWATDAGAEALLDMKEFRLEVKHRGRYYLMYPMFQGRVNNRLVHLTTLADTAVAFGGWRPYAPIAHPYSTDKLLFKRFLRDVGLRTPDSWEAASAAPLVDYLLKVKTGSFGHGLAGPFRAGTPASSPDASQAAPDVPIFAEQFVKGQILKVWFWGGKAFFAHMHPYPTIVGDGKNTVQDLLRRKVEAAHLNWDSFEERPVAIDCLDFQGAGLTAIAPEGQSLWIDYRYGRRYASTYGRTPLSDNQDRGPETPYRQPVGRHGGCFGRIAETNFAGPGGHHGRRNAGRRRQYLVA